MNDEVRISPTLCFENNWTTRFFIRMNVEDKPGMLSKITKVLGDSDVSLHSVMQKGQVGSVATIIFVTHEAKELYVKKALEEIQEKNLAEVCSLIRVED